MKQEDIEQIKLCEWLKNRTDLPFFSIANQRKCNPQYGNLLKRMGVRAGVSDLMLPRSTNEYHGTFIELKTTSGKLSPLQQEFLDDMNKEDYAAVCCYGADAAIAFIQTIYNLPR